ncbi:hypothetical protein [Amycolatopsis sp. PS_44_ISF1]|uniref:hypothetical protein n=1 Tax=Amycolatopsis sp. PS_44_ISF1 TaxID=2974917 RepID=UPI0028DDDCEB|nr:hypothetical protein [Amycolatopsis sp. PS_44_ISF1]MDT8911641.1 hypothetical protein [Amycolatopsis sp. PS_44_ISF1]
MKELDDAAAEGEDYLTRQQRALAEAVVAGAGERSFRLAAHLAAEGGVRRSDILAATALFLAYRAFRDGKAELVPGFLTRLREQDRDSVKLVRHLVRLEAARAKGWLPRAQYEELLSYAWREKRFDLVLRAGRIEPRAVEPVGGWAALEREHCPLLT